MTLNIKVILSLCFIQIISACDTVRPNEAPDAGSANSLKLALNNAIDLTILPAVAQFKVNTDEFSGRSSSFCEAKNVSNLVLLQDQWKLLSLSWNKLAMYNLGPLNDNLLFPKIDFIDSSRKRGTDYTSTIRSELTSKLAAVSAIDTLYFNNLPFTKVGVLALEILTFETSDAAHALEPDAIVTDYINESQKCDYLKGMSALLVREVDYIQQGWTVGYLQTGEPFKTLLLNGDLEGGEESVPKLITVIQEHLDYIKKRKLEGAHDAQLSDYFYQNQLSMLDAVDSFLSGVNDQYSFYDHMANGGFSAFVNTVNSNLATAKQAIADENNDALSTIIGILDGNFKREIPDGLNVTLGLVFTDGD